jgi:hypothetical protein
MADPTSIWYRLGFALEELREGRIRRSASGRTASLRKKPSGAPRSGGAAAGAEWLGWLRDLREALPALRDDESEHRRPRRPRHGSRHEDAHDKKRASRSSSRGRSFDLDALDFDVPGFGSLGLGALAALLLERGGSRGSRPGPRWVRAALSGAGAGLARELLRPLLAGELRAPEVDEELFERVAAGAVRGLIYAMIVDPSIPGPPALRGLVYGSAEYALEPLGGLKGIVGRRAPHRRLPVLGELLDAWDAGDEGLVDHLAFGLTLALLYGRDERAATDPASNGIGDDDS